MAHALLPDARPGRRLRRHRLLRRRSPAGHARRVRRGRAHRPRPGHAGDHRPGREPHLRPAPVVPGRPVRPDVALPRLVRVGRRAARGRRPRPRPSRATRAASWTYDRKARQYYLHRFYKHQPDLNIANPAVREEIARIVGFWLQLGVSGFRVDAVPFLIELDGIAGAPSIDPHRYLKDLRSFVAAAPRRGHPARRGQPAAQGPAGVLRRRGRRRAQPRLQLLGDAAHLPGAGPPGRRRRSSRRWPTCRRCRSTRSGPRSCATTTSSRSTSSATTSARRCSTPSAPTPTCSSTAAACAAGCRRCSAATRQRIRMAYSLLFSLPGTPVLFYGEEIGMGENLDVPGPHGGAHADAVVRRARRRVLHRRPRARSPARSPRASSAPLAVNVAGQRRDAGSLLNWFERLIRRRRETPELGLGHLGGDPQRPARRCSPTAATGTGRPSSPCTTSAPSRAALDAAARRPRRRRRRRRPARRRPPSTPSTNRSCTSPSTATATAGSASGARANASHPEQRPSTSSPSVAAALLNHPPPRRRARRRSPPRQ